MLRPVKTFRQGRGRRGIPGSEFLRARACTTAALGSSFGWCSFPRIRAKQSQARIRWSKPNSLPSASQPASQPAKPAKPGNQATSLPAYLPAGGGLLTHFSFQQKSPIFIQFGFDDSNKLDVFYFEVFVIIYRWQGCSGHTFVFKTVLQPQ